ncbi:MAG: hypothetical protein N2513_10765, partial [Deltaproteobacteria bacterium]|nr:hypothetical protein [Deltaproteobacteria bacterium]
VYLGGTTIRDDLALQTDRIYEYSAGMGIEIPKLKITADCKIGENRLEKSQPGTDNSSKIFANLNVYYKPPFFSSLKLTDGMIFLRAFMNDFRFSTQERNFRENSVTMGLNIQY